MVYWVAAPPRWITIPQNLCTVRRFLFVIWTAGSAADRYPGPGYHVTTGDPSTRGLYIFSCRRSLIAMATRPGPGAGLCRPPVHRDDAWRPVSDPSARAGMGTAERHGCQPETLYIWEVMVQIPQRGFSVRSLAVKPPIYLDTTAPLSSRPRPMAASAAIILAPRALRQILVPGALCALRVQSSSFIGR